MCKKASTGTHTHLFYSHFQFYYTFGFIKLHNPVTVTFNINVRYSLSFVAERFLE